MQGHTWARLTTERHSMLRRGAWYPVADESFDDTLSLEVRDLFVPIERTSVEILRARPSFWSIVDRSSEALDEIRPEGWTFPVKYAVCPTCNARQDIVGSTDQRTTSMVCDHCGKRSDVDWSDTC